MDVGIQSFLILIREGKANHSLAKLTYRSQSFIFVKPDYPRE